MALLSSSLLRITPVNVSSVSSCIHSPSVICLENGDREAVSGAFWFVELAENWTYFKSTQDAACGFSFLFFSPVRHFILICTSFTFILNLLCAICSLTLSWDTSQTDHFLFGGSWAHSFVFVSSDEIRRGKVSPQAMGKCWLELKC